MLKSSFLRNGLTGLFVVAFLVGSVACTPAAAPTPTWPPPIPTSTAAASQTPIPTPTAIPTATNTPFVPKATVKIVSQSPEYTDIAEGAQLAVQQLSAPLRDLGYAVQYQAYDDQDNVDVAVKNAGQFADDPAVLCGVGHFTSRLTINMEDLYHRAHLAFISPSSTNPEVTQRHYVEISRVTGRDDVVGASIAGFMHSQGWTSVFIARNQVDYASRVTDGLKHTAQALGLKLLGDTTLNPTATGYETVMSRVSDVAPDVVYFSGWSNEAGTFFKEARLAGYTGPLFALYGDPALGEKAGPLALEGGGLYYMTGSVPPRAGPRTESFAEDFEIANGRPPQVTGFGAEAYDAAGVCLQGIEEAALLKDGELPTREEVAKAIRALVDFQGITGTFTFNRDGEPLSAQYVFLQATSVDPSNWDQNPIAASIGLPPPQ